MRIGLVPEYSLAFGLFFRPLRKWLVPAGSLFHAIIFVTLPVPTLSATPHGRLNPEKTTSTGQLSGGAC
jgi:hypothetical protein